MSHTWLRASWFSHVAARREKNTHKFNPDEWFFFHLFTRNLLSTNANIEFPLVAQPVLSQRTEGMESNCFCGSKMGSSKNQFMLNHVIDLNRPLQFCLSTYLQHHCWWWFIGCWKEIRDLLLQTIIYCYTFSHCFDIIYAYKHRSKFL